MNWMHSRVIPVKQAVLVKQMHNKRLILYRNAIRYLSDSQEVARRLGDS